MRSLNPLRLAVNRESPAAMPRALHLEYHIVGEVHVVGGRFILEIDPLKGGWRSPAEQPLPPTDLFHSPQKEAHGQGRVEISQLGVACGPKRPEGGPGEPGGNYVGGHRPPLTEAVFAFKPVGVQVRAKRPMT